MNNVLRLLTSLGFALTLATAGVVATTGQSGSGAGARQIPAGALNDPTASDLSRTAAQAADRRLTQSQSALSGLGDRLGTVGTVYKIAIGLFPLLHPADSGCNALTSPPGMPHVPSRCAGIDGCRACYTQAYERLDRTRVNFEKLRCIYTATTQYGKDAISFGDDVSSIHGVQGLAWQGEKKKIQQSLDELDRSYDAKVGEFLGYLGQDLNAIGQCEAQYLGEADWYSRYGFMFYTFMAQRYKR